ncbi:alpha/beta hydrolase [Gammaproteobacteria bacterium 45_16_T64]|nr:alpha/beta hydrolase [Gammaproteobacteria bacterium 45_16_T64]
MATFLFLHGSFHAAWNWHKVLPILNAAGHKGISLDMPGHGQDTTSFRGVSLSSCVRKVTQCVDELEEKVILVGHSRNGIVISQAAEARPEKVCGLVYLAAYLVPHGATMMEYAIQDKESLVFQNVAPTMDTNMLLLLIRLFRHSIFRKLGSVMLSKRMQTHVLRQHIYKEALYHDCVDEITDLANVLLEAESNWSGFTPLKLTKEKYHQVPKVYIECSQDRAVTPYIQKRMCNDTPCDKIYSLDSGHSPFFSMPDVLVTTLLDSYHFFNRTNAEVA